MSCQRYRAILFDLDGTLIDNQASYRIAYEKLCQLYPRVLSVNSEAQRNALVSLFHEKTRESSFQSFCQTYGWDSPPAFEEYWNTWISLYIDSILPFSYTVDTLVSLKERGYRIGLITNGDTDFQKAKLVSAKLLSLFDHVIISDEVGIEKPTPQIFQMCALALGVKLSECLFVGDTIATDIVGAQNAGMDSLLVGGGEHENQATYTGEDITVLKQILEQHSTNLQE